MWLNIIHSIITVLYSTPFVNKVSLSSLTIKSKLLHLLSFRELSSFICFSANVLRKYKPKCCFFSILFFLLIIHEVAKSSVSIFFLILRKNLFCQGLICSSCAICFQHKDVILSLIYSGFSLAGVKIFPAIGNSYQTLFQIRNF